MSSNRKLNQRSKIECLKEKGIAEIWETHKNAMIKTAEEALDRKTKPNEIWLSTKTSRLIE